MPTLRFSAARWEDPNQLKAAIAGVLADVAKLITNTRVAALTDSSGGTAATPLPVAPLPVAAAAGGVAASTTITIATNPVNTDTLVLNGSSISFVTSGATGLQVNIAGTNILAADALAAFLQASADAQIVKLTYTHVVGTNVITATSKTGGTANNAYTTTTASGGRITVTGATLAGGTDNLAQKAAVDTALNTHRDAVKEILAKCNQFSAVVPMSATLVDSIGGNAADGTVNAVTATVAAVASSFAAYGGVTTYLASLQGALAQVTIYVNRVAFAYGIAVIVDNTGYVSPTTDDTNNHALPATTFAAFPTDTGTAATGADATTNAGVTAVSLAAILLTMQAQVAQLALTLNAVRAACATVVASTAAIAQLVDW